MVFFVYEIKSSSFKVIIHSRNQQVLTICRLLFWGRAEKVRTRLDSVILCMLLTVLKSLGIEAEDNVASGSFFVCSVC
jgi:hypothetical protein